MTPSTALDCAAGIGAAALVYAGLAGVPEGARAPAEPREVEIVAKRFAFEPSRIEVTEGATVRLKIRSADGVHGLQIKKFRVSSEVPRGGRPVVVEFTASAAGEFEIACSEYCGDGHEQMKGRLVVHAREASR